MAEGTITIRMLRTVRPDLLALCSPEGKTSVLEEGRIYQARANRLGAISGLCDNGQYLGVRPGEFEFVEAPTPLLCQWAKAALESLIRATPENITNLYAALSYEGALRQLKEAQKPHATWVVEKCSALHLKSQTLVRVLKERKEEFDAALAKYQELGGEDADTLRTAALTRLLLQQNLTLCEGNAAEIRSALEKAKGVKKESELADALTIIQDLRTRIKDHK